MISFNLISCHSVSPSKLSPKLSQVSDSSLKSISILLHSFSIISFGFKEIKDFEKTAPGIPAKSQEAAKKIWQVTQLGDMHYGNIRGKTLIDTESHWNLDLFMEDPFRIYSDPLSIKSNHSNIRSRL